MKNLIFIVSLMITLLIACNEDPLGLDENVRKTIIDNNNNVVDTTAQDTTKPKEITRVRADSVAVKYSEFIVRTMNMKKDTIFQRWTPLLTEARATIDTLGKDFIENLIIISQRNMNDEISPLRKEFIIGFSLELDSIELDKEYRYNKVNRNYKSRIQILYLKDKKVIAIVGEYPIQFIFTKGDNENIIEGEFVIDVPTNFQMNHYHYYFKGDITIYYHN